MYEDEEIKKRRKQQEELEQLEEDDEDFDDEEDEVVNDEQSGEDSDEYTRQDRDDSSNESESNNDELESGNNNSANTNSDSNDTESGRKANPNDNVDFSNGQSSNQQLTSNFTDNNASNGNGDALTDTKQATEANRDSSGHYDNTRDKGTNGGKKSSDALKDNTIGKKSDGGNIQKPSIKDKAKDLKDRSKNTYNKAKQNVNKLRDIQNKIHDITHPGEFLQNKAKDLAARTLKKAGQAVGNAFKAIGKKILSLLSKALIYILPYIGIVLLVIMSMLIIIIVVILVAGDEEEELELTGYYDAPCQEITVIGTYAGTYPVEEYVAGVVQHEVGFWNIQVVDEAFAVAARTYAFRNVDANCAIENSTKKQVYGPPGALATQAAENTKGIVLTDSSGNLASTMYDALAVASKSGGNYILKQRNQAIPASWIDSHISSKTLQFYAQHNHGKGMSQWGARYLAEAQGYDYKQILSYYYEGTEFKSTFISDGGDGSSDVPVGQVAGGILNQSLDSFLASKGSSVGALNASITSAAQRNGWGTGAGVAAAGSTLINELAKYNVKLPYFWGGGHGAVANGAQGNWGGPAKITAGGSSAQKVGSTWPNGLDCSGFVSWAIYNGGVSISANSSATFGNLGPNKTLNGTAVMKVGDILLKKGHHVALIVGIDNGSKQYITAEAFGAAKGVTYGRRSFSESGYVGVDMSSYYASHRR